ncbi:MAG: hypothetical protein WCG25_00570 [bacterium]
MLISCELIVISSSSFISHQFIGISIDLTHITNIIIREIYAMKTTGLNISLIILVTDIFSNHFISSIFILLNTSSSIINGENIITIHK